MLIEARLVELAKRGQARGRVDRYRPRTYARRQTWPVSRSLWAEACKTMGRDRAALALAIVSTKSAAHFSRSAGGYFAGMVRKDERGELRLERSLWALREARYGKATRRMAN